MPELLLPIFIFYLIYLYFSMKKSKPTTEKLAIKTPVEESLGVGATEAKAQKGSTSPNKPKSGILKTKSSQAVAVALTEKNIKKTAPTSKSPKDLQAIAKVKATVEHSDKPMSERVGLTAGSLWHYLDKNGTCPISKVVREMKEEEKIVQRSIGWLAQEGKVKIDIVDRVEIIALI